MAESNTFFLQAITPNRTLIAEPVVMVKFWTMDGEMGVLAGHEPCTVMLDSGMMMVRHQDSDVDEAYMVSGGFAVIDRAQVTVMSTLAERADRMEALLEELAEQRHKRKEDSKKWDNEVIRAEMAIRNMLIGQEISAYAILQGKGEKGETL